MPIAQEIYLVNVGSHTEWSHVATFDTLDAARQEANDWVRLETDRRVPQCVEIVEVTVNTRTGGKRVWLWNHEDEDEDA